MQLQDHQEQTVGEQIVAAVRTLTGYTVCLGARIKTIQHGETRYRITLDCYEATIKSTRQKRENQTPHRWVPMDELDGVPLSVTGRRIARHLITQSAQDT